MSKATDLLKKINEGYAGGDADTLDKTEFLKFTTAVNAAKSKITGVFFRYSEGITVETDEGYIEFDMDSNKCEIGKW